MIVQCPRVGIATCYLEHIILMRAHRANRREFFYFLLREFELDGSTSFEQAHVRSSHRHRLTQYHSLSNRIARQHDAILTTDDVDEAARNTVRVSIVRVMQAGSGPARGRSPIARQSAMVYAAQVETLGRARDSGVRVVVSCNTHHAHLGDDLTIRCAVGYRAAVAHQAATLHAAEFCRVADSKGSIVPGKAAKLIAVRGNPLEDTTAIRNVVLFMRRVGSGLINAGRWRCSPSHHTVSANCAPFGESRRTISKSGSCGVTKIDTSTAVQHRESHEAHVSE